MRRLFVLLSLLTVVRCEPPRCSWACDDPQCSAVCTPVCEAPACSCGSCSHAPTCSVSCNATYNDDCPLCETRCQPAPCSDCSISCGPPVCRWDCIKPTFCPQPSCELQCSLPSCSANLSHPGVPALSPAACSPNTSWGLVAALIVVSVLFALVTGLSCWYFPSPVGGRRGR